MTTPLDTSLVGKTNSALVITSDVELTAVIESTLRTMSMPCIVETTMQKAAKTLQNGMRPSMILIDLSVEQAIRFIKEAKGHAVLSKVPMLAMTDDPSLPEVKSALEAGANRWIAKSFISRTLLSVVKTIAVF